MRGTGSGLQVNANSVAAARERRDARAHGCN
jgi:hypothetical protein